VGPSAYWRPCKRHWEPGTLFAERRGGGMADAAVLNTAARKGVRVRLPPSAPILGTDPGLYSTETIGRTNLHGRAIEASKLQDGHTHSWTNLFIVELAGAKQPTGRRPTSRPVYRPPGVLPLRPSVARQARRSRPPRRFERFSFSARAGTATDVSSPKTIAASRTSRSAGADLGAPLTTGMPSLTALR
jgi:hypothetical protein